MTDLNNGLILHLPLNEGSGTKVYDKTKYQNHGTITDATFVDGKFGKALSFDGSNNYVSTISNFIVPNSITICGWIKINTLPSTYNDHIISHGYQGNPNGVRTFDIDILANGKISFSFGTTGNSVNSISITNYVTLGEWAFICATYDSLTGYASIQLNDVIYNTIVTSGNLNTYSRKLYFSYSSYMPSPDGYFDGIIDNVRIYNRVLSIKEIRTIYHEKEKDLSNGLVLNLPLSEGSGTKVYDKTKYQNHGVLSAGVTWDSNIASFNGSNGKIIITKTSSLNPSYFTISAWVMRTNVAGANMVVVSNEYFSNQEGFKLSLTVDNNVLFLIRGAGSSSTSSSPSTLSSNSLHHLVVTYDGISMNMYIDGNLVVSKPETRSINYTNQDLHIGNLSYTEDHFWKGTIAKVKLWNRSLSGSEVKTLYQQNI
jgi:hypothetical protein